MPEPRVQTDTKASRRGVRWLGAIAIDVDAIGKLLQKRVGFICYHLCSVVTVVLPQDHAPRETINARLAVPGQIMYMYRSRGVHHAAMIDAEHDQMCRMQLHLDMFEEPSPR